ncbi:MAG: DUF58 domain-containing protein [Halioglobus sp.]
MRRTDVTTPPEGAFVELQDLIALRFPAKQLKLTRRKRALSMLAGPNTSNFRSRGIDFEEVRSYQPGDDVRTIDWRVTARTGSAHTKVFREEKERPLLVVVDQRNSMFFGSTHCFKSVLAAHLASLVAWSALDAGDRVGGLVFNGEESREVPPRRSRKNVLGVLSEIARYNAALPLTSASTTEKPQESFGDMLKNLRRVARPGTRVFLISDFAGATDERAKQELFELAKHTELVALACADPLEAQLPQAGTYAVTNGQARSELHTADKQLRQQYALSYQQQREGLGEMLLRRGVPLIEASTAQAPYSVLQTYYGDTRR